MIELDRVRFGYGRDVLYEDFSLRIDAPGVYGLFGRNGSGKSTLLKLMAGLLFRQRGRIEVLGHDPQRRDPGFLASVHIVPEEFHLPDLSSRRLAATQAGFYPRFSRELLDEALATFQLDPDRGFATMSLGEKKKAVVAFALATRTPLLLLDEPTNGLDIVGRDQFRKLVRHPTQADRMVLISTHQAHDLERILDRVLFVDRGRLALSAHVATLAGALRMGVAAAAEVDAMGAAPLHRETIGDQVAYVAAREAGEARTGVQLELLYKALSLDGARVLEAIAAAEGRDD